MPANPFARVTGYFEGFNESLAAFFVGPVICVAEVHEVLETAREKMFGDELCRMRMIFEHARVLQVRTAEAEVDGRLFGVTHEFGEVIAGAKPGEDTVAFPAPRDDFFANEVGRKVPAMFLGKPFDAAMHAVVIPPEGDEDPLPAFVHGSVEDEG